MNKYTNKNKFKCTQKEKIQDNNLPNFYKIKMYIYKNNLNLSKRKEFNQIAIKVFNQIQVNPTNLQMNYQKI